MPNERTDGDGGDGGTRDFSSEELLSYLTSLSTPEFTRAMRVLDAALQPWLEQYPADSVVGLVRMLALRHQEKN